MPEGCSKRAAVTANARAGRTQVQSYAEVVVRTRRRWVRFFVAHDQKAPWPRYGLWRTRGCEVRGVNLRLGAKFPGPCVVALVHWRRLRDDGE